MEASLLITESVINAGMSALVAEVTADEAFAWIHEGEHYAVARIGSVNLVGGPDAVDRHDHDGEEEAMICFASHVAMVMRDGDALVVTTGDEAALRARAQTSDDDFRALVMTRVATGSMSPATGQALLMRAAFAARG